MSKIPRGPYAQELKNRAVSMAADDGLGVAETARRLSLSMKTLACRVAQYRRDKEAFTREIVGFSMSARMDTSLVLSALTMALRNHCPPAGLIIHSDRGSQHCSAAYQKKLEDYGSLCSMSRKGNCHDNAPMESFRGLLKNGLAHRGTYQTRQEAISDVTECIEIFYNRQRRQAALGCLSPAAFIKMRMQSLMDIAA